MSQSDINTIPAASLEGRHLDSLQFIDVRTPAEYRAVHAQFARLLPLEDINAKSIYEKTGFTPDQPVYLLCQSGKRATSAAQKLVASGVENCFVIEGGTNAWVTAGLPTIRGKGVISLERQVRISAGSLILVGVLLGWFVCPWFFLLSGFVGCGLIFAGVTDWCGMALLLATMPWNK